MISLRFHLAAGGQPREEPAVLVAGEEGGGSEAGPQDEAPLPGPGRRARQGQGRTAGEIKGQVYQSIFCSNPKIVNQGLHHEQLFRNETEERKKVSTLEVPGIEPGAFHMQSERATTALHPQS